MNRRIFNFPAACWLLVLLLGACTAKKANLSTEVETIKDAYWMLLSLEGQDIPAPQDTRMAYIRFQEGENDVFGFTGCNKFSGHYVLTGDSLQLLDLEAARMGCENREVESKLLNVLRRVDSYRLSGSLLTLYDGATPVATFQTGTRRSLDNEVRDERNIYEKY